LSSVPFRSAQNRMPLFGHDGEEIALWCLWDQLKILPGYLRDTRGPKKKYHDKYHDTFSWYFFKFDKTKVVGSQYSVNKYWSGVNYRMSGPAYPARLSGPLIQPAYSARLSGPLIWGV
jgi:hypothetical protein